MLKLQVSNAQASPDLQARPNCGTQATVPRFCRQHKSFCRCRSALHSTQELDRVQKAYVKRSGNAKSLISFRCTAEI